MSARFLGIPGSFGASKPLRHEAQVTVNTHVTLHRGHLFAQREVSRPTQPDPDTLDSLGTFDCGGNLQFKAPYSSHDSCAQAPQ